MRRLSDAVKRRIFEHLACFLPATEVCNAIADEFNMQITPRHVRAYDPDGTQFVGAYRWVEYHTICRQRFLDAIAHIPIARKVYRLWAIQRLFDEAYAQHDYRRAAALLKQAARECGAY